MLTATAPSITADEDLDWQADARCRTDGAPLTARFFSEQLDDIAAAKAFCAECPVRGQCLDTALRRREPWGVWGGELLVNGRIVANKRPRGRPPKVRSDDRDCARSA
ncbi:MAG: WhiB family transcriptional regulator [Actinomycetota bacterium]